MSYAPETIVATEASAPSRGGEISHGSEPSLRSRYTRPNRGRVQYRQWARYGFIAPVVVYLLLFFVYPLVQNIVMSLQNFTATSFYTGQAPYVGFANYSAVFQNPQFMSSFWITVIFVAASIAFQFAIGLALAIFFTRSFPLNGLLRSLLLVPWLLPLIVSGTVFRWIFNAQNGVLDQGLQSLHLISHPIYWLSNPSSALIAVIIVNVWVGVPFNMVILYGGLQGIPESFHEAAELDGANGWQRFRYVSLPLLKPVTTVVLTLGLIYTIKVFDVIMVMTQGGPANATETLTIWSYNLSFINFNFGQGAAVGNLLIVVALVFGAVYIRSARIGREGAAAL
jgi:multiple sugar transport system permease protein